MNKTNHPSCPIPRKKELEKLYLKELKSTYFIARKYNVSTTPVKRWFQKYGIKLRNYAEASKITRNGFKEGIKHQLWKGNKVSYQALHSWVRRHRGIPQKCENCGTIIAKKYEWANISKKYKRELNDWVRLCTKCHRQFDKK